SPVAQFHLKRQLITVLRQNPPQRRRTTGISRKCVSFVSSVGGCGYNVAHFKRFCSPRASALVGFGAREGGCQHEGCGLQWRFCCWPFSQGWHSKLPDPAGPAPSRRDLRRTQPSKTMWPFPCATV